MRDSAGITIVESPAALEARPFASIADSAPVAGIGTVDGPAEYQLFRVTSVALLADGRIVVANGGSQELRFYDEAGRFLKSAGRRGDGPGEYQFPAILPSPYPDSLLVYDAYARRFSVLTAAGEFVRAFTPLRRVSAAAGVLADGRVVTAGNSASAGFDSPEGLIPNTVAVEIVDTESAASDTVGVFEGPDLFLSNQDGRLAFTTVPFDVAPSAASRGGQVLVTPGRIPEILEFDGTGALVRISRVLREPVPITRQQFDAFVAARVAAADDDNTAAELRRRYRNTPVRESLPAFQRLLVDAEDNVWAEHYREIETVAPVWTVFDPDGAVRGTVALPPGARLQAVGHGRVAATRRDELDVEHVIVWRLVPE